MCTVVEHDRLVRDRWELASWDVRLDLQPLSLYPAFATAMGSSDSDPALSNLDRRSYRGWSARLSM